MQYKRILTIQDISCVGQCSMTVAMPVLSACGHETCLLPTMLLSTHTGGFGKPIRVSFSDVLPEMVNHWQRNGITFDAILVGYLGSVSAIRTTAWILDTMLAPGGVVIVDPAMADHGKLYSGFDGDYVPMMKELCQKADIVLPNITEAALLSGVPYRDAAHLDYGNVLLDALPYRRVLLTGVGTEDTGFLLKDGDVRQHYAHRRLEGSFSGTGDLFASAFTGTWLAGKSMYAAAKIAADFTCRCVAHTVGRPAHWYGVKFEPMLPWLIQEIASTEKEKGERNGGTIE